MLGFAPCPFCGSTDIESDAGMLKGAYCPGCMECGALAPLAQWNVRKLAATEQTHAAQLYKEYEESEAKVRQLMETKRLDIAAQFTSSLCTSSAYLNAQEVISYALALADLLIEKAAKK